VHVLVLIIEWPEDTVLPLSENTLRHIFVGDEAYLWTTAIMKPYSRRTLDRSKAIFNCRLSRVRRVVECAFGICASKWRILDKSIEKKSGYRRGNWEVHNFIAQYFHRRRGFAWLLVNRLWQPGCKWRYSVQKMQNA